MEIAFLLELLRGFTIKIRGFHRRVFSFESGCLFPDLTPISGGGV